jgi:hypothetical protein
LLGAPPLLRLRKLALMAELERESYRAGPKKLSWPNILIENSY